LMGKFDVGLNYRKDDSFGLRLGVQATKKIYLGYVYELPISEIRKASSQSHEMAVRYFLINNKKQTKVNKDELKIEDSERSNKNAVVDFGPYVKKEQAETVVSKVETVVAPAAPIAAVVETKKEEIKQEVKAVESTQKVEVVEKKIVEAAKPKVETLTKTVVEEAADDFEYVTVTKTRVVLKRPKVSNTTANSVVKTQGSVVSQVKQGANTQPKKIVKRKPRPKAAVSTEPKEIDPNAPIITRKRISNNITETTVEKRGATESEIGSDGKTKVSKRKRKDGTEETTYTTTEVVKKKKEKKSE
jgi:hypothetical protein